MGFVVLHMEKAHGSDSGTTAHIERFIIPKNADPTRTHLNRKLIDYPDGVKDRSAAIQRRLEEAGLTRKIGSNQVRAIRINVSGTHEDMERIEKEGRLDEWCADNLNYFAFMFGKEASEKLVKVLSGGERTRLAMIKLLLEPVNLLILDEPTNHLDLKTKEILKEALMAFDGTLIVVSHDRDFLDGLTDKIYEFSHGRVTEHLDGVYGFLRKKKIENISEIERRKA